MKVQSTARKSDSVVMHVVDEVAEARDVDPVSLTPPLASVVDPDALETIVHGRADTAVSVEFSYAGCHVSVAGDEVTATPQGEDV